MNYQILYSFLVLLLTLNIIVLNTPLIDVLFKWNTNLQLFHILSIFWLTSWYVPYLIDALLMIIVWWFCFYLRVNYKSLFIIFFFIFYIYENYFFLISFTTNQSYFSWVNVWNTLLLNTLNYYHPFMFYIGFTGYSILCLILISILIISLNSLIIIKFIQHLPCLIFFFLIFLILGGWWAFQEQTWGGWWNWDLSEVFGLVVSLYFVITLHSSLKILSALNSKYSIKLFFYIIIWIYLILHISFSLSSHNFGTRFLFFFNDNFFFIELVICSLFLILFTFSYVKLIFSRYFIIYHQPFKRVTESYYTILIVLSLIYFFKSSVIVLNFIINFFTSYSFFYFPISYQQLNYIFLILSFLFWIVIVFNLSQFVLTSWCNNIWLWFITQHKWSYLPLFFSHFLFIWGVYFNIFFSAHELFLSSIVIPLPLQTSNYLFFFDWANREFSYILFTNLHSLVTTHGVWPLNILSEFDANGSFFINRLQLYPSLSSFVLLSHHNSIAKIVILLLFLSAIYIRWMFKLWNTHI